MNIPDVIAAIIPVVEVLEDLGVPYHIGGSVASSIYGLPRLTIDADLVADLRPGHVRSFVIRLKTEYYVDEDSIRDAIRHHSSFNLIHFDTSLKVDIFIPKSRLFDQEEMNRAQAKVLEGRDKPFNVASPEGTILNKLEWYKMGGGVSDRQWNDIQGVLKVRGTTLDMGYLRRWAAVLDVSDLLERALSEAGLSE